MYRSTSAAPGDVGAPAASIEASDSAAPLGPLTPSSDAPVAGVSVAETPATHVETSQAPAPVAPAPPAATQPRRPVEHDRAAARASATATSSVSGMFQMAAGLFIAPVAVGAALMAMPVFWLLDGRRAK